MLVNLKQETSERFLLTGGFLSSPPFFFVFTNVFPLYYIRGRLRLKCDGTRTETRFSLSTKWVRSLKSAGGVSSVDYWQPRCAHQR